MSTNHKNVKVPVALVEMAENYLTKLGCPKGNKTTGCCIVPAPKPSQSAKPQQNTQEENEEQSLPTQNGE